MQCNGMLGPRHPPSILTWIEPSLLTTPTQHLIKSEISAFNNKDKILDFKSFNCVQKHTAPLEVRLQVFWALGFHR